MANASHLVHPIPSPRLEHVLPATQTARPVPGLHLINVQAAQPTDRCCPMAAVYRHVPRRNSSTPRAEVVSRAIAAVRVVPAQDQVTALHAQARARSSAEDLAWQPTAMRMARRRLLPPASFPASACVFRISSRSRRSQDHPFQFPPSRGSTRLPRSTVDVSRGGRYCS